jgi:hypothetical protein
MKIAVCTLCINDWYEEIVHYGIQTIQQYSDKHNYDFYICNEVYEECEEKRDFPWYKIKAIEKILPKYDVIFWIDADGHVLKPEISVLDFLSYLPKDKDILCAKDYNCVLSTGLMIMRNTPFVHALLYETWQNKEQFDPLFHEQASMSQIYQSNRFNAQNKITILPLDQKYIFYNYWSDYYPQLQFFIHIARCSSDQIGFIFTMDAYCPIKMKEDVEGEFEQRQKWLNDSEQCRKDINYCLQNGVRWKQSTRCVKYQQRKENEGKNEKKGE